MLIHMRTTIILPDGLAERAKRHAVERGCTFTSLVVDGLQLMLQSPSGDSPPPLPTYQGTGKMLVDITDKEALWEALDADGWR